MYIFGVVKNKITHGYDTNFTYDHFYMFAGCFLQKNTEQPEKFLYKIFSHPDSQYKLDIWWRWNVNAPVFDYSGPEFTGKLPVRKWTVQESFTISHFILNSRNSTGWAMLNA